MKNTIRNITDKMDYILLFSLLMLFLISLVAIYSAAGQYNQDPSYYVIRQIIWFGVGFIAMIFVLFLEYEHYRSIATPLYIIGVLSLVAVHFFGEEKKGAQRWITMGSFDLQPSEFMKIFLIIMLATIIYRIAENTTFSIKRKDLYILSSVGILGLIPFYFIFEQPDLGTALVTAAIMGTILFVSGISMNIILLIVAGVVAFILLLGWLYMYHTNIFDLFFKDHQMERIYGWLQPDQYASSYGYQLSGARMGIGSGRLFGNGFQNGTMSQSGRVPEIHTDFIFTIIGEEFGFIGAAILLTVYFILIYRMIIIAINCRDKFGACLVTGIVGLFSFQVFQNIGMTIGLMPITGLTLPFVSYGGSSIVTNMIAIGIVLNVHVHTKKYMFDN